MAFLRWSDKMRIGVSCLDAEHMQILALTNELYECIVKKTLPLVFDSILDEIEETLRTHMQHEEDIIFACGLPQEQAQAHIERHGEIRARINEIRAGGQGHSHTEDALEVVRVLNTYLIEHVDTQDRELAAHLNETART